MSSVRPQPARPEIRDPDGDRQDIRYRRLHPLKAALARGMDAAGLNTWARRRLAHAQFPYLRAVNYHDTIRAHAAGLAAQFAWYAREFVSVGWDDLLAFAAGHWPHSRPGIVITFDDGWRCQARVAAPLLEKHGLIGWFFVPVGFVDEPEADFVREQPRGRDLTPMGWDDLRELARRHVIGCHTYSHHTLPPDTSPAVVTHELDHARSRLETELGRPCEAFSWVWGREQDYHPATARAIEAAGFRVSFLTTPGVIRPGDDLRKLPRTNVEARFPPWLVRYQLSGWPDRWGAARRRRIEARLEAEAPLQGASAPTG